MRLPLATLAVSALLAAPAAADVPAGNLVVNPGADAGAGAPDSSALLPLPGWTVEGTLTAVQYGAPDFPTATEGGGANFFAGGPGGELSAAVQTIDVAAAAAEIDSGRVTATLSALIGGYDGQEDAATVTATPIGASGLELAGAATIGPVTQAERAGVTTLLRRAATARVPAGTRSIRVRIVATRSAGSYNDGYVDTISLTLGGPPVAGQQRRARGRSAAPCWSRRRAPRGSSPLEASLIRNGTEVDARNGVVEITRSDGGVAKFSDGIFKLTQAGGVTILALSQELSCGRARAAQAKVKTRKLWGDGKGKFRTKGRYSAATVRGTKWLVQDTCTTTVTRVTQGSVAVRDSVRKRTVIVRKGGRYVARRASRAGVDARPLPRSLADDSLRRSSPSNTAMTASGPWTP